MAASSSTAAAASSVDWQHYKKAGNDAIARDASLAHDHYTRAISLLPANDTVNLAILLSNRAFASIKQGQFSRALIDCEEGVTADPTYDKVLLRRAQVRRQLGDLSGAIKDFKAVLTMTTNDPTRKTAQQELVLAEKSMIGADVVSSSPSTPSSTGAPSPAPLSIPTSTGSDIGTSSGGAITPSSSLSSSSSAASTPAATPTNATATGGVRCTICGQLVMKVLRCTRCKLIAYCSARCQRAHWGHHKIRCDRYLTEQAKKALAAATTAETTTTTGDATTMNDAAIAQAMVAVEKDEDANDELHRAPVLGAQDVGVCGMVGLRNLGNTCYMNSALQCLSSCPELMRYLISDQFIPHINVKNPLGKGGALAVAYASICKEMMFGTDRIVRPMDWLLALRKLAPQFQYGEQHDSQEFLTFLLDALHEDLNRVVEKPYRALPDSNGRDDHDVAADSWAAHTARNQSTLVDLFQGQYKSTLQCTECEHSSVTFDPFLSLSLPIPGSYDRVIRCSFFASDGSRPIRFNLTVNGRATFAHFKFKLVERIMDVWQHDATRTAGNRTIAINEIMCAQVINHRFWFLYGDGRPIDAVKDGGDVAAFQTVCSNLDQRQARGLVRVKFLLRYTKLLSDEEKKKVTDSDDQYQLFGQPFVMDLPATIPMTQLYESVRVYLQRMIGRDPWRLQTVGDDGSASPFTLRYAHFQGKTCGNAACTNKTTCSGCILPFNDGANGIPLKDNMNVVIDFAYGKAEYRESEVLNFVNYTPSADQLEYERLNSKVDLHKCFRGFTEAEVLAGQDEWYCKMCKKHVKASKKLELWRLPPLLVVVLKRFKFTNTGTGMDQRTRRDKITTYVDFPLTDLDLTNYIPHKRAPPPPSSLDAIATSSNTSAPMSSSNSIGITSSSGIGSSGSVEVKSPIVGVAPEVYDLFGVVNHYGDMGYGHYNAFALRPPLPRRKPKAATTAAATTPTATSTTDDSKRSEASASSLPSMTNGWCLFDDAKMYQIEDVRSIQTSQAYVMFYRRRDRLPPLPIANPLPSPAASTTATV